MLIYKIKFFCSKNIYILIFLYFTFWFKSLTILFISQELGNMEKEKEWLIFRYGLLNEEMLYKLVFCIDIDNINLSWNDKSIEYDQLE